MTVPASVPPRTLGARPIVVARDTATPDARAGCGAPRCLYRVLRLAPPLVLVLIAALTVLADVLSPVPPNSVDLVRILAPPQWDHPLGTDESGRDVLARLLHGGRVTISVALVVSVASLVTGTVVGLVAGYAKGAADAVLMRLADAMLAIPVFFFVLVFLAVFGSSIVNVVVVLAATSWMAVARVVRSEVLRTTALEFVTAAEALGASPVRIVTREVLPHVLPSTLAAAGMTSSWAILMESALSFLGLGVTPPTASWGNLLSAAQVYIWSAPHLAVLPGALIFVTVLSVVLSSRLVGSAMDRS